ncbi:MAG: MFS transporter [Azospirillaceae bacterium]
MYTAILRLAAHGPSAAAVAVFAVNGALFAAWVPRIPEIKARLEMGEAALGLALLGMPAGLLVAMTVVGWLVARLGVTRMLAATLVLYAVAIVLPTLAPSPVLLAAALFFVGLGNASMDVTMNVGAAAIERRRGVAIMGACHGGFSLGSMIGAGLAGLVAAAGIAPTPQVAAFAALIFLFGLWVIARMGEGLADEPPEAEPAFTLPPRGLLGLGVLGMGALLIEGAMADWTAVYLREELGGGPAVGAAGFTGFSLAMAIGRFQGDTLVERIGAVRLLRLGAVTAAVGLVIGPATGNAAVAVLGFLGVGFGIASVVPILFRAAAATPGIAPGTAIAAVASTAYLGFLLGPPLIGLVAEVIGLGPTLALLALPMAGLYAAAGTASRL